MRQVTRAQVEAMTLEEIQEIIEMNVYEATAILEKAEQAGLCWGNGHHARQKLAKIAAAEVATRWKSAVEAE